MNSYWWCPTCQREIDGSRVTHEELCDSCGFPVKIIESEDGVPIAPGMPVYLDSNSGMTRQYVGNDMYLHASPPAKANEWSWYSSEEAAKAARANAT